MAYFFAICAILIGLLSNPDWFAFSMEGIGVAMFVAALWIDIREWLWMRNEGRQEK